nr:MAG TPA: hypothetical protein [Herelleviridae sp.]
MFCDACVHACVLHIRMYCSTKECICILGTLYNVQKSNTSN